jgi:hypothetical protein
MSSRVEQFKQQRAAQSAGSSRVQQFKQERINPRPKIQPQAIPQKETLNTEWDKPAYDMTNATLTPGNVAKSAANTGKSLLRFGKGVLDFLNPVNTAKSLAQIPSAIKGLAGDQAAEAASRKKAAELEARVKATTGKAPVAPDVKSKGVTAGEYLKAGYQTVTPPAVQKAFQGKGTEALQSVAEDPYQLAPLFLAGKTVLDKTPVGQTRAGQYIDRTVSNAAAPIVKTGEALKTGVKETAKFGTSQITGMNPETIKTVIENPKEFSSKKQASYDREGVAGEVHSTINQRLTELSETGKEYQSVRQSKSEVKVEPDWINKSLQEQGWSDGVLSVDKSGAARPAIKPTKLANISQSEQTALNKFMDVWGSKKKLTAEEFLDGRQYLDRWSKWQSNVEATQPGKALFRQLRHDFNKYGQNEATGIKGLKQLDETYGAEAAELRQIQKEYLNADGTLKDSAPTKIANLTNRGREQALSRLENIKPGITRKIKVLKAVEDIQNAGGQKVGTYARGALGLFGVTTMNVPAVVAAVLGNPAIATQLLRAYGTALGASKAVIEKSIQETKNSLNSEPNVGLSIKNVTSAKVKELQASWKRIHEQKLKTDNKGLIRQYEKALKRIEQEVAKLTSSRI